MARLSEAALAEMARREAKRIRDRNYRFRKMTPAQQRVTIAKDVIRYIAAGRLEAKIGVYLEHSSEELDEACEAYSWCAADGAEEGVADKRVDTLLEQSETCKVCGIGAVFYSGVMRANNLTIGDVLGEVTSNYRMRDYLSEWFTREQLGLIECAFEMDSGFKDLSDVSSLWQEAHERAERAAEFGSKFSYDSGRRLEAIMTNIIENGGLFVP